MNFNILAEVEPTVSLVVHFHSRDDLARGVDCLDPSLPRGNCIPPKGYEVNELDDNLTGAFPGGGVVIVLLPLSLMTRISRAISPTCSWVGEKLHVTVSGIMASTV